jgi:hypothetical protein
MENQIKLIAAALTVAGVVVHARAPQSPVPPQPAPLVFQHTAGLVGTVVRRDKNTPIAGARIVAARVGGPVAEYRTATTDDAGRFGWRDLAAGSYRVYAEHENYLRAEYGGRLVSAAGVPVSVLDGQTGPPIVIAMTPPGVIAGRVLDRGRPARRIVVRALRTYFNDGLRGLSVAAWAQTDDRGEFRIFDLVPGSYVVSAAPFGRARIAGDTLETPVIPSSANGNTRQTVVPLSPETLDSTALDDAVYPTVFHPGTTDITAALPIEVRAGDTVSGITLSIARARPFRVTGRVESVLGATGARRVRVWVYELRNGSQVNLASVESTDGAFVLTGIPPGRYMLTAQTVQTQANQARMAASTPVEVVDRDLENIALTLVGGVTVTGKMTVDGRAPGAADGTVGVQLIAMQGNSGGVALRLQPDGTFALADLIPGEYRLRILSGAGHPMWVKAAHFGAEDVTNGTLKVDAELHGRELEIALGSNMAVVDVTVQEADGRPAAGVLVVAVPDAARRNRSSLFKSGTTDAQGRLRLADLAPGEYRLFATGDIEAGAWQDPDVLRRYEARGQTLRIAEGTTQAIALRTLR